MYVFGMEPNQPIKISSKSLKRDFFFFGFYKHTNLFLWVDLLQYKSNRSGNSMYQAIFIFFKLIYLLTTF